MTPLSVEQVWRLENCDATLVDDRFCITTFVLKHDGKEYIVSVTGAKGVTLNEIVNALRAGQAHLMSMAGIALPDGARKPAAGELEAPKTCQ